MLLFLLLITFYCFLWLFLLLAALEKREKDQNSHISVFLISTISTSWHCGWEWLPSSINKRKTPCVWFGLSLSPLSTWKRSVGVRDLLCETRTVPVHFWDLRVLTVPPTSFCVARAGGGYSSWPAVWSGHQSIRIVSWNKWAASPSGVLQEGFTPWAYRQWSLCLYAQGVKKTKTKIVTLVLWSQVENANNSPWSWM